MQMGVSCSTRTQVEYSAVLNNQFSIVSDLISQFPILNRLVFCGQPLGHWVSDRGRRELLEALDRNSFDPVALRHEILRLKPTHFFGEVIWGSSFNPPPKKYIRQDSITIQLSAAYGTIRSELDGVLNRMALFPDSDALTNFGGTWSYLPFFSHSSKHLDLGKHCPETAFVISNLTQPLNLLLGLAFFSSLSGNSSISAHRGSTSLRQRYHLGVIVPQPELACLRIDDTWVHWAEGSAFGFNDSYIHEVKNQSALARVALIVDVWPQEIPKDLQILLSQHPYLFDFCVLRRPTVSRATND